MAHHSQFGIPWAEVCLKLLCSPLQVLRSSCDFAWRYPLLGSGACIRKAGCRLRPCSAGSQSLGEQLGTQVVESLSWLHRGMGARNLGALSSPAGVSGRGSDVVKFSRLHRKESGISLGVRWQEIRRYRVQFDFSYPPFSFFLKHKGYLCPVSFVQSQE